MTRCLHILTYKTDRQTGLSSLYGPMGNISMSINMKIRQYISLCPLLRGLKYFTKQVPGMTAGWPGCKPRWTPARSWCTDLSWRRTALSPQCRGSPARRATSLLRSPYDKSLRWWGRISRWMCRWQTGRSARTCRRRRCPGRPLYILSLGRSWKANLAANALATALHTLQKHSSGPFTVSQVNRQNVSIKNDLSIFTYARMQRSYSFILTLLR